MDRKTLLLYSKTLEHKYKVQESLNIIKNALKKCDKWYVAFSGGKDATALFYLIENNFPNIVDLHFGNDELIFPETIDYIELIKNTFGYRFFESKMNVKHGDYFEAFSGDSDAIKKVPNNWDGCFMGLRAEENTIRKNLLKRKGKWAYYLKNGNWHCHPLLKWKVQDVWAYIYSNNIPYNKTYDIQLKSGIKDLQLQRVIPFGYRKSLDILRKAYPSLYNEWLIKFPQAGLMT
jgi:3'-phosphoadenosine 5'-phosphosulfate sulfotransferase (PAPS reductase)/FAD synthetase